MKLSNFSLNQLTDLALVVPEAGVVNFNILHVVLKTILKHLDLGEIKPLVDTMSVEPVKSKRTRKSKPKVATSESASAIHLSDARVKSSVRFSKSYHSIRETSSKDEDWKPPENAEILAASAEVKEKLVSEMWHAIHLTKRMDAAEDGVQHLSTLMDCVLEELQNMGDLQEKVEKVEATFGEFGDTLHDLQATCVVKKELEEALRDLKPHFDLDELKTLVEDEIGKVAEKANTLDTRVTKVKEEFDTMAEKVRGLKSLENKIESVELTTLKLEENINLNKKELEEALRDLKSHFDLDELKTLIEDEIGKVAEKANTLDTCVTKVKEEFDTMAKEVQGLKSLENKIESVELTTVKLEEENTNLNKVVQELNAVKLDKDGLEEVLGKKVYHEDLQDKASKSELESKCDQIDEELKDLARKLDELKEVLKQSTENMELDREDMVDQSLLEGVIADYENRLRFLEESLRKLREYIYRPLSVDAAGVTKCISCGRPARPAGREIYSEDGKRPSQSTNSYGPLLQTVSIISLPDCESTTQGIKGPFLEPLKPVMRKKFEKMVTKQKNESWKSLRRLQSGGMFQSTDVNRYVGGQHTITEPQQRGNKYVKYKIPNRKSTEDVVLRGIDGNFYKGTAPKKLIETELKRVFPKNEERDPSKSGYSKGARGFPEPEQKDVTELAQTRRNKKGRCLTESDRLAYKDGGQSFQDRKEAVLSKRVISRPHAIDSWKTRSNVVARTTLKKNEVNVIGQDGRVYRGCIVQIPQYEGRVANKSKLSRKQIYVSDL